MSAQEVLFRSKKCAHVPSVPLIKTLNHSNLGVRPLKRPCLHHFFPLSHILPLYLWWCSAGWSVLGCLLALLAHFIPLLWRPWTSASNPASGTPRDHPLHTSLLSWAGEANGWDGRLVLPRADPQLLLPAESERFSSISEVCLNLLPVAPMKVFSPKDFYKS